MKFEMRVLARVRLAAHLFPGHPWLDVLVQRTHPTAIAERSTIVCHRSDQWLCLLFAVGRSHPELWRRRHSHATGVSCSGVSLRTDFMTRAKDSHMEYKSIDFVTLFSGLLGAGSVLGAAALTFGPWAPAASDGPYALLVISGVAFGMLSRLAGNVSSVLTAQADQIADLRRQLKEQTSRG